MCCVFLEKPLECYAQQCGTYIQVDLVPDSSTLGMSTLLKTLLNIFRRHLPAVAWLTSTYCLIDCLMCSPYRYLPPCGTRSYESSAAGIPGTFLTSCHCLIISWSRSSLTPSSSTSLKQVCLALLLRVLGTPTRPNTSSEIILPC